MTVYDHWLRIQEQTTAAAVQEALAEGIAFAKDKFRAHHPNVPEGYITRLRDAAKHRLAFLEQLQRYLTHLLSHER